MSCSDYDADYFGSDTYNNISSDDDESNDLLSWRLDPDESLSDWSIIITGQTNKLSNTYHVHKNILAVGPSKSDYFVSLFRCSNHQNLHNVTLQESTTKTSYITLEDSAASVFPILLDFMYTCCHSVKDDDLLGQITTENSVALRYLSQYFGIKLLHKKVMKFVQNDIKNLDTIATYIESSKQFCDERMLDLAANKIAESIQSIDADSNLLKSIIDPLFFLRIVNNSSIDTCGESSHLSKLIASYCHEHTNEIDHSMFTLLTSKRHMPLIHRDAALSLLKLETLFLSQPQQNQQNDDSSKNDNTESDENEDDNESSNTAAASTTGTTCLQRRCIKVLALYWKDNKNDNSSSIALAYKDLPPLVLAELLEKSLSVAKQNCDDIKRSRDVETSKLILQCEEKDKYHNEISQSKTDEYNKMKKELTDKIASLKSLIAERDRQLVEQGKVLSKFKRVPVTHAFRPLAQATYHHLSGDDEPFDAGVSINEYDVYGRTRPKSLPPFCDDTEDGYIYKERKAGKMHYDHYPVYYYKDI